jgi:hypothetical protein
MSKIRFTLLKMEEGLLKKKEKYLPIHQRPILKMEATDR